MILTGDDLLAIERAVVRGWPAVTTRTIAGWLARVSSGGSVRANSVAAHDFAGGDVDAAIRAVSMFYREQGARPRFTITGSTTPVDLDVRLAAMGWQRKGDHVTMARSIAAPAPADARVEGADAPDADWTAVYLQGLSASNKAVAPDLVARVPVPRRFFSFRREGVVIAGGLSVLDGDLASIQCMATMTAARRTGAATAVLAAIEGYASGGGGRRLYLQTDAENVAAVGLYQRVGFTIVDRYHVRELAD